LELAESSAWGISGLNLSAADFNEAYIKEHATKSISHGVAAAWALLFISKGDTSKMPRAVELVMSGDVRGASLSEAVAAGGVKGLSSRGGCVEPQRSGREERAARVLVWRHIM